MSFAVGALDIGAVPDIEAAVDIGVEPDIEAALDTEVVPDIEVVDTEADLRYLNSQQIQSSLEHHFDSLQQVVVEPLKPLFERIFLLFQR